MSVFLFYCYGHHRDLPSFPTRRSSDLGKSAVDTYRALALHDVQHACDILRPVYDRTDGFDGYVSWEEIGRHTSELQSHVNLVCRLLLEKKKCIRGRTVHTVVTAF